LEIESDSAWADALGVGSVLGKACVWEFEWEVEWDCEWAAMLGPEAKSKLATKQAALLENPSVLEEERAGG
jgi:hypothetical protein